MRASLLANNTFLPALTALYVGSNAAAPDIAETKHFPFLKDASLHNPSFPWRIFNFFE